jgi:hypothetical protein
LTPASNRFARFGFLPAPGRLPPRLRFDSFDSTRGTPTHGQMNGQLKYLSNNQMIAEEHRVDRRMR